ncbi:MAG: hypothetical protein ABIG96_03075 [Candidatus Micrarchaeota archaeon]
MEEFREELIGISEKLNKYSAAMQESLNILSDEFLLLRDELSALNQNLDRTKDIDSKLEDFNKTVVVLHGLQDKLKLLENLASSLAVADGLSAKIDTLAQSVNTSKEHMGDAVAPLSKKMDLLYSKFDESLSPLNKRLETFSDAFKEELRESADMLKGEESLKALSLSLQEELNSMQKAFGEQTNAIKSISTSVAYLSNAEGEVKKGLDGLVKVYQQDREKSAADKGKFDSYKEQIDLRERKLDEIIAMLKVQSEQMAKQNSLLESPKAAKQQPQELLVEEMKKQGERFDKLEESIGEQVKLLALVKASIPTGNFEEVIKHADVINESTNSKLDSVVEMNNSTTKALQKFNENANQLPSLMQNISVALDTLVQEMRKSQTAYKSLEAAVQQAGVRPSEAQPAHMEKLESITENIRGLHAKMDTSPQFEVQLKEVVEELKKFEELEKQRLAQPAITQPVSELQLKAVVDELKKFEELEKQRLSQPQVMQPVSGVSIANVDAISQKLDTNLILIKKELSNMSAGIETLKGVLTQGADISAEVDFTPLLKKMEQMQNQIASVTQAQPMQAAGPALQGTKLMDQRDLLEEMQQNIRIFQSFELSDRAKIVVDRLDMLVKRCLSLYSS